MKTTNTCCLGNSSELTVFLFREDIEGLTSFVDNMITKIGNPALLEVNKVLASPANLAMLIAGVLKNDSHFQMTWKESYYHENGFHKLVLLSGDHFKLRLHHFGAGVKLPMENIHDHRWSFASSIIAGHLHMELFESSVKGGETLHHYLYDSRKSSGEYGAQRIGLNEVGKTGTRSYGPGQQYLMLPHELHRITNKQGEESITLILTGKPERHTCNLYAKRTLHKSETKMEKYPESNLRKMLEDLREKIYPTLN